MGKCYLYGNGGSNPLNFEVVGNPKPSNPKENTIWVNTDKKIPKWYFIPTQPENMTEGDVWFLCGTNSPVTFNALKKNTVMVYPFFAKQYVSGALVDVETSIYQKGAWVVLNNRVLLYNSGDVCTDITGGWQTKDYYITAADLGGGIGDTTIELGSASMVIKITKDGGLAITSNEVDLTDYKTLTFRGDILEVSTCDFGVFDSLYGDFLPTPAAYVSLNGTGTSVEYTLDVSGLTGRYYIGFAMKNSNEIVLHQIYLEE